MIDTPYFGFYPAKVLSYNSQKRTCMVSIEPFTRGSSTGKEAKIAYPIGHDDYDTEIMIKAGMDVYVFFEAGLLSAPVVAFCRSHGVGAEQGVRRIRQDSIELIANSVKIDAKSIQITGNTTVDQSVTVAKSVTAPTVTGTSNVTSGGISLKNHTHGGVERGNSNTTTPQ